METHQMFTLKTSVWREQDQSVSPMYSMKIAHFSNIKYSKLNKILSIKMIL